MMTLQILQRRNKETYKKIDTNMLKITKKKVQQKNLFQHFSSCCKQNGDLQQTLCNLLELAFRFLMHVGKQSFCASSAH
jgi:hypothetical protein